MRAIAATTMPKRKKQTQQQQPPHQQPPLTEREETGDEEDGSPIGPPSLLGPPPMANGKPGDPKSAPHWNPPTCPPSVEWINKVLCVHPMGYYTAVKMKALLLQASWMNLINTMLSKRTRHKRMQTAMGVPPGEAFTKSREILEGSKAGLLSRIPAHPRMDPRLWKTNPTAPSADTLPKKATVDMRTSVPSTTLAPMDLLCETVPSHPGWKEPAGLVAVYFPVALWWLL